MEGALLSITKGANTMTYTHLHLPTLRDLQDKRIAKAVKQLDDLESYSVTELGLTEQEFSYYFPRSAIHDNN